MEIPNEAVLSHPPADMQLRERQSLLVAANCLLIAIIGNFLFYDQRLGINMGIYTTLLVGVGVAMLIAFEAALYWKHLIFGLPAAVFALFLAVRSAEPLSLMNLILAVGSLFVFIRFGRIKRFLGGGVVYSIMASIESFMTGWIEGPLMLITNSARYFDHLHVNSAEMVRTKAVVRGLILAVPILIVFGILLGSADVVFGDLLEGVFGWLSPDTDLVVQILLIAFLMWANLSMLRLLIFGPPFFEKEVDDPKFNVGRLGMIETSILLGSVNLLFLVFVILQGRYLFGGDSNISVQGYTYAEYARRGFYEMLAVSIMTTGLIGVLEWTTHRQPKEEKLFRILTTLLIVLTGVILVAAWRRLALYEDAYGYTQLRFASAVFMGWLGVLLAILLADVLLHRRLVVFFVGALVCMFGYVGTLNALNMDQFIARHNVERFDETGKIDVPYLLSLSDDAIPAMVSLIDAPDLEEADRETLLTGLANRLEVLDRDHAERKGADYHWGKDQAWQALDQYRDELTPYMGRNPAGVSEFG
ncbi:MAG: DUF4173 domain-containing protein [Anaerolineae bacterium]|nr:DUF4173 domain-containing protein [Anaerolineae bacterium]